MRLVKDEVNRGVLDIAPESDWAPLLAAGYTQGADWLTLLTEPSHEHIEGVMAYLRGELS